MCRVWAQISCISSPSVTGWGSMVQGERRFRDGLVFKAHRLLYRSTLGLRVIKKQVSGGADRLGVGDVLKPRVE